MFSKVICYKGFWKSVSFLTIMFIIIYNLVDWGFSLEFDFNAFINQRLASENLLRFIFANILSGFVYGFIVSFFKFRNRIKNENPTNTEN